MYGGCFTPTRDNHEKRLPPGSVLRRWREPWCTWVDTTSCSSTKIEVWRQLDMLKYSQQTTLFLETVGTLVYTNSWRQSVTAVATSITFQLTVIQRWNCLSRDYLWLQRSPYVRWSKTLYQPSNLLYLYASKWWVGIWAHARKPGHLPVRVSKIRR